ncbi:Myb domain protein 4r1 [Tanacetum coccineum]
MKLTSMSVDTNQPSSQIMNDKNLEDNDIAHAPKILAVVWQNCKEIREADSVDGRASVNHISSNLTYATNVSEGHEPGSKLIPTRDCGFLASAQAFFEAIKKNRIYQKFLRDKLIKIEARLEDNKKSRERIKFFKGFQVDCRRRMGRALSHKKDPRFQLILVPKLRANTSKGRGQINTNSPGTKVAVDSAATLVAASIVIKMVDSGYSSRLLKHSKSLFTFGDKYRADNPILLQQHREKMHKAMKDVNDARVENRRRRQQIEGEDNK